MIMDELYTFITNKHNRYYVWTSIAITSTGKKFYYYHLSHRKTVNELLEDGRLEFSISKYKNWRKLKKAYKKTIESFFKDSRYSVFKYRIKCHSYKGFYKRIEIEEIH